MLKVLVAVTALGLAAVPATPVFAANSPPYLVDSCRSQLQRMDTIVRKQTVAAVGPSAHVSVIPFCIGVQVDQFGNAAGLGKTIGANRTLARALARSGYKADDVTSITIRGNSVQLYVHPGS